MQCALIQKNRRDARTKDGYCPYEDNCSVELRPMREHLGLVMAVPMQGGMGGWGGGAATQRVDPRTIAHEELEGTVLGTFKIGRSSARSCELRPSWL